MNLFETFQKYKKGTFRKLNESFVRKTKKMTSSSVTDEADSMIVSIELPIAELIRKRCPIHPKMLRYNEEKERMEYVRDKSTNEVLIDKDRIVYSLYYKLYPIIGELLGIHLNTYYDSLDPYSESIFIKYKRVRKGPVLTVNYMHRVSNYFNNMASTKISEISVPEDLAVILDGMKKYNEFEDKRLIPLYARALAGIFMKFGDTVSTKKAYVENPTELNLSNINKKIIPEGFDLNKAKMKLNNLSKENYEQTV